MLIYNSHLDPSMFDGSKGFDLSKIGACLTEEEDARKAGLFHEHENLWLVSHIKLPIKTVGVDYENIEDKPHLRERMCEDLVAQLKGYFLSYEKNLFASVPDIDDEMALNSVRQNYKPIYFSSPYNAEKQEFKIFETGVLHIGTMLGRLLNYELSDWKKQKVVEQEVKKEEPSKPVEIRLTIPRSTKYGF